MEDYQVERVVIRQRPMKGKFGRRPPVGFSGAAIENCQANLDLWVNRHYDIKESLKRNPTQIRLRRNRPQDLSDVGLQFTAYAY